MCTVYVPDALGGQKRVTGPLGPELRTVTGAGPDPGASVGAAHALYPVMVCQVALEAALCGWCTAAASLSFACGSRLL